MTRHMIRQALCVALFTIPAAWAQTRPLRIVSLPATSDLTVSAVNGSVLVETWDGPGILVRAEINSASGSYDRIFFNATAGTISVISPSGRNYAAKLRITVPPSTALRISAVNGNIALHDVTGDVSATAVNGSVTMDVGGQHWAGENLHASTVNGNIEILVPADCAAKVTAAAVKGTITSDFTPATFAALQSVSFDLGDNGAIVMSSTKGNIGFRRKSGQ